MGTKFESEYKVSKIVNKIVRKNTPWVLFFIGVIIFLFGEYSLPNIIGTLLICGSFFLGGKEFGHGLGFKDGWSKNEE